MVRLEILDQDAIEEALDEGRLDLLFTNPSHYVQVRSENPLTGALATLISLEDGQPTDQLGGVIIARDDTEAVEELADLRGRHIGVPGMRYPGGFQTQAFELQQAGVRLPNDAEVTELGGHDQVVESILAGEVEYGFVRTGIIESLTREGKIDPARLQVIHARDVPEFPYRVSTRLYPEWAFVALPRVERHHVHRISSSLLALDADHPVSRAAGIAGFAPPGTICRWRTSPGTCVCRPLTIAFRWRCSGRTIAGWPWPPWWRSAPPPCGC